MLKNALFQIHWLLGITAGVVIAIVGVTGAALSFEHEILHALNYGVVTVDAASGVRLTTPALLDAVSANNPGKQIMNINVFADPNLAARVTFAAEAAKAEAPKAEATNAKPANKNAPQRRRGESRYVNPYNGEFLGEKQLRGEEALQTIERVHRGMVAGLTGRMLVGIATIALVFFALSGLYLRWPKSGKLKWQTWFKIHTQLKGRAFLWNLHSMIGTWLLPIYVVASLTGLYFAFDWYRQGLISVVGASPPSRDVPKLDAPIAATNLAAVWTTFETVSGGYESATVNLPQNKQQALEIRYLKADAAHERAQDRMLLNPENGALIKHEIFTERTAANRFVGSMLPIHSGSYFGIGGTLIVMFASLAMPLFAITGWMLYLKRRASKARVAIHAQAAPLGVLPESG